MSANPASKGVTPFPYLELRATAHLSLRDRFRLPVASAPRLRRALAHIKCLGGPSRRPAINRHPLEEMIPARRVNLALQ